MEFFRLSAVALAVATLAGCAVAPKQLTPQELTQVNQADQTRIAEQVEPIGASLSIEEAVARALKYNLDQRVKMLEQSLASAHLESGRYDMLPSLLASAGYDTRNNYRSSYEAPLTDPSNINTANPSVSSEKGHFTADLRFTWNVLDFGASYYTAQQNADRLLIANEKRRKSMHTLAQSVRAAYWRALASEKLADRVRATIKDAEKALSESSRLAAERVKKPDESLRYQRNLLENLRLLENVERELVSARIELNKLIGALPGSQFSLVEPASMPDSLQVEIADMEAMALLRNADLREQHFNARIAALDTRKALLKLLPGLNLNFGGYYDDDKFLVNDAWMQAGTSVSFNLFNVLSYSSRKEAAEKNEALAQMRRMALQMSVLTQVHLATHQYEDALRQFKRADAIYRVDKQLEDIVRGKYQSNMTSEQTAIAANVTTILSELRRYQTMSKVQESLGLVQASIGMEPRIDSLDDLSLEELTVSLQDLTQQVTHWMTQGVSAESLAPQG